MSLFPLAATIIIARHFGTKIDRITLLRDGQLLFFSAAISANVIFDLFKTPLHNRSLSVLLIAASVLVLFFSVLMYALAKSASMNKNAGQTQALSVYRFSIGCTLSAIAINYIVLRAYFSRSCIHGSCPYNWPFWSRLVAY